MAILYLRMCALHDCYLAHLVASCGAAGEMPLHRDRYAVWHGAMSMRAATGQETRESEQLVRGCAGAAGL